ncbi:MAG: T9SS type A sorting domain-containing protein [Flavobacteriaceae bacterium]|nr:T9SS type A sorting domain-containing protein [Flavobacteriaceae bacterium]
MKNNYLILLILLTAFAVNAQVSTGFSEPDGTSLLRYVDADLTDHFMANTPGVGGAVTHTSTGGEMGFTTFFSGNLGTGLSDGDTIGVYDDPDNPAMADDNISPQLSGAAYSFSDPDGILRFESDLIDLTATVSPRFQMNLSVRDTGWETSDRIYLAIERNNGALPDAVILDTTGQDIDVFTYPGSGALLEGNVTAIDFDLTPYIGETVNFVIESTSNSAAEEGLIDDLNFTEGTNATLNNPDLGSVLDRGISLYPNPTQGQVTLDNYGHAALEQVEFTDINGRVIATYNLNGLTENKTFDLTGQLTTGIYFVRITSNEGSTVKKLMVQ